MYSVKDNLVPRANGIYTFIVSSAIPEGASAATSNLALATSAAGKNTLNIDNVKPTATIEVLIPDSDLSAERTVLLADKELGFYIEFSEVVLIK